MWKGVLYTCQFSFLLRFTKQLMTMLKRQFLTGIDVRDQLVSPPNFQRQTIRADLLPCAGCMDTAGGTWSSLVLVWGGGVMKASWASS
jgi:hypothetical protein